MPRRKRTYRSAARMDPEVTEVVKRLGAKIRSIRKERGLTQESLAGNAKLDAKHIQAIEAGRTNPTVATLVGIARSLGTPIADLFRVEPDDQAEPRP